MRPSPPLNRLRSCSIPIPCVVLLVQIQRSPVGEPKQARISHSKPWCRQTFLNCCCQTRKPRTKPLNLHRFRPFFRFLPKVPSSSSTWSLSSGACLIRTDCLPAPLLQRERRVRLAQSLGNRLRLRKDRRALPDRLHAFYESLFRRQSLKLQ